MFEHKNNIFSFDCDIRIQRDKHAKNDYFYFKLNFN